VDDVRRRANGEGSLRRKPDGRWEGTVQLSGRRYWVSGRTETEARRKLKELGRQHNVGELVPPTRLTLGDFLDQWLETNKGDWKPKTLEGYRSLIDNYTGVRS
jgi:integrase